MSECVAYGCQRPGNAWRKGYCDNCVPAGRDAYDLQLIDRAHGERVRVLSWLLGKMGEWPSCGGIAFDGYGDLRVIPGVMGIEVQYSALGDACFSSKDKAARYIVDLMMNHEAEGC